MLLLLRLQAMQRLCRLEAVSEGPASFGYQGVACRLRNEQPDELKA